MLPRHSKMRPTHHLCVIWLGTGSRALKTKYILVQVTFSTTPFTIQSSCPHLLWTQKISFKKWFKILIREPLTLFKCSALTRFSLKFITSTNLGKSANQRLILIKYPSRLWWSKKTQVWQAHLNYQTIPSHSTGMLIGLFYGLMNELIS